MVVCKFFLQGTCKFGNFCHYEHQVPNGYNYTSFSDSGQPSTSILRQSNFGAAQTTKPAAAPINVDANMLVKSVVTDMTGAEKGGQWLLSSYAPFKEKPAFPGFEDYSPEEIRLGFYEAQKNGTMDQCKQQLQMLLQNTMIKVRALQSPSPEVVGILQSIYNTPPSSFSGTYGQNTTSTTSSNFSQQPNNVFATQNKPSFGQGQQNNIFAGTSANNVFTGPQTTQAQTNIFASSALASQNQNIFASSSFAGGQNTGFTNQQPSNIFSGSGQTTNPSNVFATQSSNPPAFGTLQQPANIFASPTQTAQPQNVFAQQQNKPLTQNIFASQNQPTRNIQQNIFASQIPQQQQLPQQNVFNTKTPLLPTPQQNVSPLSYIKTPLLPTPQQNVLPPSYTKTPLLPTPQQNIPPPSYSASIFGSSVNTNPSVTFGTVANQPVDESLYSKLEELDAEEKKWFESDTLDIFNIPDKPPTYDMCFKT